MGERALLIGKRALLIDGLVGRHVTHMNELCLHMNEPCHTNKSVILHSWMSYVTHMMTESFRKYECAMIHAWKIHVTRVNASFSHVNESCHTYEWVTSHAWVSNESCHTWMSLFHMWMSRVTHINESRRTHEWVLRHMWPCLITHSCVQRYSFICVTRPIHMWKWRIYTCDMIHYSLMCATWLIYMCDTTHLYVWNVLNTWVSNEPRVTMNRALFINYRALLIY